MRLRELRIERETAGEILSFFIVDAINGSMAVVTIL